ncbi:enoyl-ACP reductase FabI [Spiribacter pallidus]|jgi:enoyl-[acyl-carrier protein] reductase I|uniref:Enoyl-[acyl-carrier-protein] reductase [NADH] n=1 Tax=Spiribacter pallidus TaxID=1987936 RepID=A0ABV3TAF7_9GAMM
MTDTPTNHPSPPLGLKAFSLAGRVGIITGLANDNSIAFGCARALHALGATFIVSYASEKSEPFVMPLAEAMGRPEYCLCDVEDEASLAGLFDRARRRWGRLDFVIHSIAFAPLEDLHGRVTDASAAGFGLAMDVSCHSFIRMARHAEPLMDRGGALLAMTYHGADQVVGEYNLMGPVKAALQSTTRYLASELGPSGIRVNTISPGPIRTRAASGLKDFDTLAADATARAPLRRLVTIEEVGNTAAWLIGDAGAAVTGGIHYVDGGHHNEFGGG